MLTDLMFRVGVEGKTRDELTGLLGAPQDGFGDSATSYWFLCPSFMDFWVLRVEWKGDRAISAYTHDT